MRCQQNLCTVLHQVLEGLGSTTNPGIVCDLAVFHGHVEVSPDQHALALQLSWDDYRRAGGASRSCNVSIDSTFTHRAEFVAVATSASRKRSLRWGCSLQTVQAASPPNKEPGNHAHLKLGLAEITHRALLDCSEARDTARCVLLLPASEHRCRVLQRACCYPLRYERARRCPRVHDRPCSLHALGLGPH